MGDHDVQGFAGCATRRGTGAVVGPEVSEQAVCRTFKDCELSAMHWTRAALCFVGVIEWERASHCRGHEIYTTDGLRFLDDSI
jgi:hypothetical protein